MTRALVALLALLAWGPARSEVYTGYTPAAPSTVAVSGVSGTVAVAAAAPLDVALPLANQSAFGDLIAVGNEPVIQSDFVYGILDQLGATTTSNGGTVTTATGSGLRVRTSAVASGSAVYTSRRTASYRPGQGITARFTARFPACVAASTLFVGMGNNATDAIGWGCDGATFGILHRNNGVSTWIPQASWNGDTADGAGASGFNWTKAHGNVLQIRYPYLGYGGITFWAQNPATSRWLLLHTIRYSNSSATTELAQPSLHFLASATNTGNTTDLEVGVGSVGVFISGERAYLGSKWGVTNSKSGVSTTPVNIVSLRSATTFNGVASHMTFRLRSVSIAYANTNASVATIVFTIGATLGGSPSYTPVSGSTANAGVTITAGQSPASFDVAGTTVSGGYAIQNFVVTNAGSHIVDLTPFNIFVGATETLTVSASATNSGQVGVGLTWDESN